MWLISRLRVPRPKRCGLRAATDARGARRPAQARRQGRIQRSGVVAASGAECGGKGDPFVLAGLHPVWCRDSEKVKALAEGACGEPAKREPVGSYGFFGREYRACLVEVSERLGQFEEVAAEAVGFADVADFGEGGAEVVEGEDEVPLGLVRSAGSRAVVSWPALRRMEQTRAWAYWR